MDTAMGRDSNLEAFKVPLRVMVTSSVRYLERISAVTAAIGPSIRPPSKQRARDTQTRKHRAPAARVSVPGLASNLHTASQLILDRFAFFPNVPDSGAAAVVASLHL
jgi:hypothetical protein